jgi:carbamoylphosphate synthase large subunit
MLAFYGSGNSWGWHDILNVHLLHDLQKINPGIKSIINLSSGIKSKLSDCKYIVPFVESDMMALHDSGIQAIMPRKDIIEIFMCKKKFSLYVEQHDLSQYVPKTYASHAETIDSTCMLFIVKPHITTSGCGSQIVTRAKQTSRFNPRTARTMRTINPTHFNNNIIQEYITNDKEYVAHIIAENGRIAHCIVYMYLFCNPVHIRRGCISRFPVTKITSDQHVIDVLEKFLLPCGYTGICNIDFIIDNDNVKVFEINPRLGGSLIRNTTDLILMINKLLAMYDKQIEIGTQ